MSEPRLQVAGVSANEPTPRVVFEPRHVSVGTTKFGKQGTACLRLYRDSPLDGDVGAMIVLTDQQVRFLAMWLEVEREVIERRAKS